MPSYPSNFINGAAPGVQSKNNISDRIELRIGNQTTVASAATYTVRVATTANITLSNTQTIDTVSVVATDRVLVKNQNTASENGIYVCVSGGAWTRATDFNENSEVLQNSRVYVTAGSANIAKQFYLATDEPIVVGTTDLTFTASPTAVSYPSAAKYPTDANVGVADITNASDTLGNFATVLAHLNKEITAYNTAYTALDAQGSYAEANERSFLANMDSNKINRLKYQMLLDAYRLKNYTALMIQINAVGAPSASRYPSGWNRGWNSSATSYS